MNFPYLISDFHYFLKGNFKGNMLFQSTKFKFKWNFFWLNDTEKNIWIKRSSFYLSLLYQAEESYFMRKEKN